MLSGEEQSILADYSAGRIGWRAACNGLRLMDVDELHALLEEHDMPAPVADATPPDDATVARFRALFRGEEG